MADKLVTIAQLINYSEADLARQLLAGCGIKSFVIEDKYWLPDQEKL